VLEHDPSESISKPEQPGGASARDTGVRPVLDARWVNGEFDRFERMLASHADPDSTAIALLDELATELRIAQGAVYLLTPPAPGRAAALVLCATHAGTAEVPESFALGEGLVGQAALDRRKRVMHGVPDHYWRAQSALGSGTPSTLAVVPVRLGEGGLCVLELGFFEGLAPAFEVLLDRLAQTAAVEPLVASASAAADAGPAQRQAGSSAPSEPLPSLPGSVRPSQRYGFWGKLSHELRSPLNSVLVLSKLLAENPEENLSAKQVAFANAIHRSGSDLLALVNAMSDLSKIETNRLVLELTEMTFSNFRAHLQRAFEPLARARGLEFSVRLDEGLPASMVTDSKRLRQIIKCLLSNALKFTESGGVSVGVTLRTSGWSAERERLTAAPAVVAFAVSDTGIGMSESEQRSLLDIFPPERIEARRDSGASGFGLAISRELARWLGGELRLSSAVGAGSTFTLFLPLDQLAGEREQPDSDLPPSGSWPAPSVELEVPGPGAPRSPVERGETHGTHSPSQLSGLEIMLVDDDVRTAFALTGLLERHGAVVCHAEDVDEALLRLEEGNGASALVIDAELLSAGSEASVRDVLERYQRLPIIALTRASRSTGAPVTTPSHVHQLAKPVDPRQLVSVLGALAAARKSSQS
jgi:signal transduction histidine kinase/ActR/RegA family two-component response regulator